MAATTPYQQNDYQAVSNYRPYQLPINDIFKALQAQNQFWEEGARRVKSVYDNALNLKLSLEPNREIRKRFMEKAEQELTKLSSMDLSDPSIQKQGFNIFKPLFQDVGVMSDDQATRWIDDVQSDIQRAREQDNGKGYADSNAMVAMEGVFEFKNAKDRMAGQQYLANKRSFTPYYDPSKELMDITKNCKGPSISSTKPGAEGEMYLHTEEVSGASPIRLKNCLTAALSQRAKDQIGIDGYASYMTQNRVDHPEGKNYRALRDDYLMYNKGTMDGITQEIGDLDGKIVAFQNAFNSTKDPRYLDMKKAAEEARSQYLEQGKNLTESFNQIAAGNLDFIKKNYGQLAEQIYTGKQLGTFSEAFRTDNTIEKYSADAVRLQQQRLVYDEGKTQAQFDHDVEMENLRSANDMKIEALKGSFKGKKLDANGNLVEDLVPTSPAYRSDDKQSQGYNEFQKEKTDTLAQIDSVNTELFNTLKRKYPKEMEQYTDAAMFFKTGPNGVSPALSFLDTNGRIQEDVAVQDWSSQSALLTNKLNLLNTQQTINEAEVGMRETKLSDTKSIDVGGIKFSEKEISEAMNGTSTGPLRTRTITKSEMQDIGDGKSQMITYDLTEFLFNGQVIASQESGVNWNQIRNTMQKVGSTSRANAKVRNEIYGRSMLTIRPDVYAEVNNTDKEDPTRNNILAALPGQFNLDDIKIISKDPTTGMATVSVKGNPKISVSSTEAKKRLSNLSAVDEAPSYNEGSNEAIIRIQSPYLVDKRTLSNPMTMLQLNLEKINLSVTNPTSPYAKVQAGQLIMSLPITTKAFGGTDFQIDIIKTNGGTKYEVLSKQKNSVVSADGTITQNKGMYYPTGQVFTDTNTLLEYINGTQQNTK